MKKQFRRRGLVAVGLITVASLMAACGGSSGGGGSSPTPTGAAPSSSGIPSTVSGNIKVLMEGVPDTDIVKSLHEHLDVSGDR